MTSYLVNYLEMANIAQDIQVAWQNNLSQHFMQVTKQGYVNTVVLNLMHHNSHIGKSSRDK